MSVLLAPHQAEARNTTPNTPQSDRPVEVPNLSASWTNILLPFESVRRPTSFQLANLSTPPEASGAQHETGMSPAVVENQGRRFALLKNLKKSWTLLSLWLFLIIFVVLYSLYVSETLLNPSPKLGKLLLQASDTNLLISVLSQVLVGLLSSIYKDIFDALRWHFAIGVSGLAMPAFFELSAATSVIAAFLLSITSIRPFWGFIR